MPKYMIILEGRDKNHPMSTCTVHDENEKELGACTAVLTEAALLGALRAARAGSDQEIWAACERAERRVRKPR